MPFLRMRPCFFRVAEKLGQIRVSTQRFSQSLVSYSVIIWQVVSARLFGVLGPLKTGQTFSDHLISVAEDLSRHKPLRCQTC